VVLVDDLGGARSLDVAFHPAADHDPDAGEHVLEDDIAGHVGDLGVKGQVGVGEARLVADAHSFEQLRISGYQATGSRSTT
jgi:hypothetical protein